VRTAVKVNPDEKLNRVVVISAPEPQAASIGIGSVEAPAALKAPRGLPIGIVDRKSAEAMAAAQDLKDSEYGFHYPPSHYQDFAGPQSSRNAFQYITWKLYLLEEPTHRELIEYRTTDDFYNARLGAFTRRGTVTVTIAQLKQLLADRIQELGVSDEMIDNWNFTSRLPWQESNAWHSQPFEIRMQTFRKAITA
jgi:hypothetical protein